MQKALLALAISLLLLGCIGGGSPAKEIKQATPTELATATPPADYAIEFLFYALPSQRISSFKLGVDWFDPTKPGARVGAKPPREFASSSKARPAESFEIKSNKLSDFVFDVYAESAELGGVNRPAFWFQPSIPFKSLELPEFTSAATVEIKFDLDASIHQTNVGKVLFLPVVEVAVSDANGTRSLGRFGLGVDGQFGKGHIVSSNLKIKISGTDENQTFEIDNTPPEIPLR